MNKSTPVIAEIPKAPQVQRSSSWCMRVNERRTFGIPSNRRSTTRIVPNTVTIASTWSALMIATAFSDVRIHSLNAELCAASTRGVRSTLLPSREVPRLPDLDVVRDPAPEEHDRDPQHDRRDGHGARLAGVDGALRTGARRCHNGAAEVQRARDADHDQRHLDP